MTGMEKGVVPKEKWDAKIEKSRKINSIPVANPRKTVKADVREEDFEGMQVFSWNASKQNTSSQRVLFYIHGGAYIAQPVKYHYKTAAQIASKTQSRVVFPIYPKIPDHNYREAFKIMLDLYERTLSEVDSPERITLMGDSAGGGFALGLAHLLCKEGIHQPKDIILLSPWLDINTDNPEIPLYEKKDPMLAQWGLQKFGLMWADGKGNLSDPLVSPIFSDSFSQMGKISLFCGTDEIFCPDVCKLHVMLSKGGITHNFYKREGQKHVFPLYPTPEGQEARKEIVKIILS